MKVIDIMCRIENGEEIPHFKIDGEEYHIDEHGFISDANKDEVEWYIDKIWLQKDVELIEDKKIKKLTVNDGSEDWFNKINEIIDVINEKSRI